MTLLLHLTARGYLCGDIRTTHLPHVLTVPVIGP